MDIKKRAIEGEKEIKRMSNKQRKTEIQRERERGGGR